MQTKLIQLVIVLVAIFAPLSGLNAQEVEKPKSTPPVNLLKDSVSETIPISVLSEDANGYVVREIFVMQGKRLAVVQRIGVMSIDFSRNSVSISQLGECLVVKVPWGIPEEGEKKFTGFIKKEGGKIGMLYPITGEVTFYE